MYIFISTNYFSNPAIITKSPDIGRNKTQQIWSQI